VRFARGSLPRDQLHEVYRNHVRAVYAFFAYSVSHHAAEDLTAATFERVIRHWNRFDPTRSGERTWIMTIARNLLTDHYRRQGHRVGPSLDDAPHLLESLAAQDDPAESHISLDTARGWLAQLSQREREVLALRYGADLATPDVARLLRLSEANVLQISSRALRRLRRELERPEAPGNERISGSA
jgi:RNA polymerase sigma-70 factor (ECF subfamily)